jgi:hypothetical protein
MAEQPQDLSAEELEAQGATALPDKEVVSILDLNADLNLAIDAAAPIDLGVAANANVAAPIEASAGANVLSDGSTAAALSQQGAAIDQAIQGDSTAFSHQDSDLTQGDVPVGTAPVDGTTADTTATPDADTGTVSPALDTGTVGDTVGDTAGTVGDTAGTLGATDGNLLNVDVNLDGDVGIAAPINGAVAANANVAAPIDAAVAANIGSVDSDAVAVSQQDAIINQNIDGAAEANSDQTSDISQP